MSFALLWGKILESSLWVLESKETRLVWIAILAMKNKDGNVYASLVGLADRAKVSLEECKAAIAVLTSPDEHDTSKVNQGIRLEEIPGGWHVVNHDSYQFSTDARRAEWRERKAQQRLKERVVAKPPAKRGKPLRGEPEYVEAVKRGAGESELDAIVDKHSGRKSENGQSEPYGPGNNGAGHPGDAPGTTEGGQNDGQPKN